MFGSIGEFAAADFFESHRYGSLYYLGQPHGLEFFAFVHADAYDSSIFLAEDMAQNERMSYLNHLLSLASHVRTDVAVSEGDHIVLLSTCSSASTNGRDILIGKIGSLVFTNPFEEATSTLSTIPAIDELPALWEQIPLWGKSPLIILPALAIILGVWRIKSKPEPTQRGRRAISNKKRGQR